MYRGCRIYNVIYEYFTYFVARFRGVCVEFILVLDRLVFVARDARANNIFTQYRF